jgi:flagellar hook-associated protein 2
MSSSGVTTSTSTSGAPIAITGLASGLDTSAIISELMAINRQPLDHITILQEKTQAQQQQLTAIQTSLQTLSADAAALSSPSLFSNTQAVTSSDSTRVSATSGSTTGAGVGGYQVSVSQLANSAQRTFTFVSPSSDDAVTIDGHQTTIKAGSSAADFVSAINSDPNATVYAATTDSGTVVLSNRTTGDTGTNFIQVADSGGSLTEQTGKAKEG